MIPNYMQCAPPGEGSRSFPSFFPLILLLILGLGSALFPPESAGQKPEGEGLSRFDRLAEEAAQLNKRREYGRVISLLEPYKTDKKNDSAIFFNELAIAYRSQGKLTEAIQAYREAQNRDPENPVILINLGYVYYLKKEHLQAVEQYQKAIHLAPRFKEAHSILALAYYDLNKYEEALKEIDTALALDPRYEEARKLRADILKKLQEKK